MANKLRQTTIWTALLEDLGQCDINAQTDMTCLHSVKCCFLYHLQETELSLPHLRKVQTINEMWMSENCQTKFACSIVTKHIKAKVQHMHANAVINCTSMVIVGHVRVSHPPAQVPLCYFKVV